MTKKELKRMAKLMGEREESEENFDSVIHNLYSILNGRRTDKIDGWEKLNEILKENEVNSNEFKGIIWRYREIKLELQREFEKRLTSLTTRRERKIRSMGKKFIEEIINLFRNSVF